MLLSDNPSVNVVQGNNDYLLLQSYGIHKCNVKQNTSS